MIAKPSIENIQIWVYSPTQQYDKYDVVTHDGYFYVAAKASIGTMTGTTNLFWKRFDQTDLWKFNDVWKPSYTSEQTLQPTPAVVAFGDGYMQRSDAGIYTNLLSYKLSFLQIKDKELKSLVSFFEFLGGIDYFRMDINPFVEDRRFVAKGPYFTYSGNQVSDFTVEIFEWANEDSQDAAAEPEPPTISFEQIGNTNSFIVTITPVGYYESLHYKLDGDEGFSLYTSPITVEGGRTVTGYTQYREMVSGETIVEIPFNKGEFAIDIFNQNPINQHVYGDAEFSVDMGYSITDPDSIIDDSRLQVTYYVSTSTGEAVPYDEYGDETHWGLTFTSDGTKNLTVNVSATATVQFIRKSEEEGSEGEGGEEDEESKWDDAETYHETIDFTIDVYKNMEPLILSHPNLTNIGMGLYKIEVSGTLSSSTPGTGELVCTNNGGGYLTISTDGGAPPLSVSWVADGDGAAWTTVSQQPHGWVFCSNFYGVYPTQTRVTLYHLTVKDRYGNQTSVFIQVWITANLP